MSSPAPLPSTSPARAQRRLGRLVRRLLLEPAGDPLEPLAPAFRRQAPAVERWLEGTLPETLAALEPALAARVASDLATFLARHFPGPGPWERRGLGGADGACEPVRLRWEGEGCLRLDEGPGGLRGLVHLDLAGALAAALERFVREALFEPAALREPAAAAALGDRIAALGELAAPLFQALGALEAVRLTVARGPRGITRARWCFTLERLAPEARARALASPAQRAAWSALLEVARDEEPSPTLPVDSSLFAPGDAAALLEGLGDLEAARDGVLVLGDNGPALRLLARRFAGAVQCAYLDPPFNTASAAWAYPDREERASWLSFMDERLRLCRALLREDGTLYAHIDQHEKERLRLVLDRHLHYVAEVIWRIGWVSGFKTRANKFIRNHDTIYQYGRSPRPLFVKHYLPYPEGYRRRDGKPPTGAGIPLEDTWNCSAADRLDSIQIMSFSREKVGRGDLTQKGEALLARMLRASSRPGDWVLDPFLGSGSGCATAHKLGRRWLGIERGAALEEVAFPRLLRVLFGEPYGISREVGWRGGGAFERLDLEPASSALARALGEGATAPLDPVASLAWLAGLRLRRCFPCGEGALWAGTDAAGAGVLLAAPGCAADADRARVAIAASGATEGAAYVFAGAELALPPVGWTRRCGEAALAALLSASGGEPAPR